MPTYISKEGLEELKEELEKRLADRKNIAEKIGAAKELGDLSENFEYHEAKDQQAQNESRIYNLEQMIKEAEIVEEQQGSEIIGLGVSFKASIDGDVKTFQIVGSTEADPIAGKISNESPIGQAFIGHKTGETVEVTVPSGVMKYEILEIS